MKSCLQGSQPGSAAHFSASLTEPFLRATDGAWCFAGVAYGALQGALCLHSELLGSETSLQMQILPGLKVGFEILKFAAGPIQSPDLGPLQPG